MQLSHELLNIYLICVTSLSKNIDKNKSIKLKEEFFLNMQLSHELLVGF